MMKIQLAGKDSLIQAINYLLFLQLIITQELRLLFLRVVIASPAESGGKQSSNNLIILDLGKRLYERAFRACQESKSFGFFVNINRLLRCFSFFLDCLAPLSAGLAMMATLGASLRVNRHNSAKSFGKRALFFLLLSFPVKAVVQDVSQSSQLEVGVTLYPEGMALIKEKRKAFLKQGSNKLLITGVPSYIVEDSFTFLMAPPSIPVKVLEYNFQTPNITRDELLRHSIGENIEILPSQLVPMPSSGKLLAVDGEDCIVDSIGKIVVLKKNRIAFSHLPYTLVSEPLITLKLMNYKEGEYFFHMGYLAKGFTWDAGYTVVLDSAESHLDLDNWINIRNKSGMDIKKGRFLIADIQNAREHFYDMEKPLSLADNATKNISWFSAQGLTPTTSFRIFPKNNITHNEEGVVMKPIVETWLSVQNDLSHGLGIPLPQGVVEVFRRDSSGSLFYVGENKTPFISVGKALSLRVGSTKEITAEMRQTDYRKLGSQVVESGYRLDLKNETTSSKKVSVFQNVTGDWSILRETHPHEEEEKRLQWTLTLAAQEAVSLRYRIRMNVE